MANIVIIIGSLKKGGAERNAAILANHLVSSNVGVLVLLLQNTIEFELDKRVNVKVLTEGTKPDGILDYLKLLYKIRRAVVEFRPSRVVSMSRIGGLIAASLCVRNTIVRFDIYPLIGYKWYKKYQFWLFYNFPWVRYVVCPSNELRSDVDRFFVRKSKLVTIFNPLLPSRGKLLFDVKETTRPYFLVVGRLSSQKRVYQIVEAYYRHKLFEVADLEIVGDGPEHDAIARLISIHQLDQVVNLRGFVADPQSLMSNAVALVSASFREGFPNVIIEALNLGTPVISSKAKTGPSEILWHGENGLLFEVDDFDRMAELMLKVATDRSFYYHLKENSKKGLERFSFDSIMKNWEYILLH